MPVDIARQKGFTDIVDILLEEEVIKYCFSIQFDATSIVTRTIVYFVFQASDRSQGIKRQSKFLKFIVILCDLLLDIFNSLNN